MESLGRKRCHEWRHRKSVNPKSIFGVSTGSLYNYAANPGVTPISSEAAQSGCSRGLNLRTFPTAHPCNLLSTPKKSLPVLLRSVLQVGILHASKINLLSTVGQNLAETFYGSLWIDVGKVAHGSKITSNGEVGYLRLPDVLRLIPVSKGTWFRGRQSGRYPRPVKLGIRASGWKVADMNAPKRIGLKFATLAGGQNLGGRNDRTPSAG